MPAPTFCHNSAVGFNGYWPLKTLLAGPPCDAGAPCKIKSTPRFEPKLNILALWQGAIFMTPWQHGAFVLVRLNKRLEAASV